MRTSSTYLVVVNNLYDGGKFAFVFALVDQDDATDLDVSLEGLLSLGRHLAGQMSKMTQGRRYRDNQVSAMLSPCVQTGALIAWLVNHLHSSTATSEAAKCLHRKTLAMIAPPSP